MSIDLRPATERMTALLQGVRDDQRDGPTPCPDYAVGDLLDHIAGLPAAFTAAARKENDPESVPPPPGNAASLDPDWRTSVPPTLATLAEAWADPAAWEGMTRVGGVDLPGEACGVVAVEELVVHGWDLARATGQSFEATDEELSAVLGFLGSLPPEARDGAGFGSAVVVGDEAPLLDRVVATSGRDPGWRPS
jgi:uncharacterized protein (TIGR03086 family)